MLENKVIKKKQLDEELVLTITKIGYYNTKITVEFTHVSGKMVVQKSFQDNFHGRADANKFSKSIKNIKDFRKYLGLGDAK